MTIRPKKDWNSRGIWGYVRYSDRKRNKIVVHHSVTNITGKTPEQQVKEEEDIHYNLRNTKHYGSIAYNFVVSRDGQTWEGMGWSRVTVANWWGDDTIAICVAGNYQPGVQGVKALKPNAQQLKGVAEIIYEGMKLGWISPDALILGHRQAGKTSCPGDNLFPKLSLIRAELDNLIATNGSPDPNVVPPFTKGVTNQASGLTPGNSGKTVKTLQRLLNKYNNANLKVDGAFGPATRSAVVAYQTTLGVTADGIWGPISQAAHDASISKKTNVVILKVGSKGNAVKDLQNILNTFVKANLNVDGIFGPATEVAVKKYQTALKVTVDGIWGPNSQAAHDAFMRYLQPITVTSAPQPKPVTIKDPKPVVTATPNSINEPTTAVDPVIPETTTSETKVDPPKDKKNIFQFLYELLIRIIFFFKHRSK